MCVSTRKSKERARSSFYPYIARTLTYVYSSSSQDDEGKSIKATKEAVHTFRESLAKLGDVYVNDAFGCAHRGDSSVLGEGFETRAAGLLMARELDYFARALQEPDRPFLSILGGAKVSDKIQLIENLLDKVDEMIIGGGMAFTFNKVISGMNIGKSLYDEAGAALVPAIMEKAKAKGVKIHLPIDFLASERHVHILMNLSWRLFFVLNRPPFGLSTDEVDAISVKEVDEATGIPEGWMGLDCGPKSLEEFQKARYISHIALGSLCILSCLDVSFPGCVSFEDDCMEWPYGSL